MIGDAAAWVLEKGIQLLMKPSPFGSLQTTSPKSLRLNRFSGLPVPNDVAGSVEMSRWRRPTIPAQLPDVLEGEGVDYRLLGRILDSQNSSWGRNPCSEIELGPYGPCVLPNFEEDDQDVIP